MIFMSTSNYYLDLSAFSLEKLKYLFETTRLLPSQQILQENMDERFACLERIGIENLAQLQEKLRSKKVVQAFAASTGLPIDYLTVLRREVNSYHPKPIKLGNFPGVRQKAVLNLEQAGIKTTKQLFAKVITEEDKISLCRTDQIDYEDILDLTKLTDVVKINRIPNSQDCWLHPTMIRLKKWFFQTTKNCMTILHVRMKQQDLQRQVWRRYAILGDCCHSGCAPGNPILK